jgi:hypothetical protein
MRLLSRFLRRSWLRWMLAAIVTVFVTIFCLGIAIYLTMLYYPRLGRISNFEEIKPGLMLPGTNYVIERLGNDFVLKNSISQNTTYLTDDNPYISRPRYTLLSHRGNLYLITMIDGGGSMGGYGFDIINISGDQPHNLMLDYSDMSVGLSCAYPRLDRDELEFEIEGHCDKFPIPTEPIRTYTVPLR